MKSVLDKAYASVFISYEWEPQMLPFPTPSLDGDEPAPDTDRSPVQCRVCGAYDEYAPREHDGMGLCYLHCESK